MCYYVFYCCFITLSIQNTYCWLFTVKYCTDLTCRIIANNLGHLTRTATVVLKLATFPLQSTHMILYK